MRIYRLECSMVAPVSIQRAFAIFEDPYNLARITPPWLRFRVSSKERVEMRRGAGIEYTIRWVGVPFSWKTVIVEYEPPDLFVDGQVRGPYRIWRHQHTFRAVEGGTEIADRVDYALPFGWLGAAVHNLLVARQLRGIFEFRQRALAGMMDAARTSYSSPTIRRL
ncbi:MAG: SRPBCC family protein [Acidobacteria bacterium]|nr:SRPBCC family protein [Acidobacteriota bacterium]